MSVWDAYVKMIDRRATRYTVDEQLKDAMKDIEQAAVFDFGVEHRFYKPEGGREGARRKSGWLDRILPDKFFLPFETVAIECEMSDDYKVVALFGRPDGHEVGFGNGEDEWHVMVATTLAYEPSVMRIVKLILFGPMGISSKSSTMGSTLYSVSEYETRTGKCRWSWLQGMPVGHKDSGQDKMINVHGEKTTLAKVLDVCKKEATAFSLHAMELIQIANSPANWVVRVSDEHARVVKRRGKPTKEKRKRYIVVPDRSLDKLLRSSQDASDFIEKRPHRRRAHYRRLNSPRFRLKQGQRVFVKESFIGDKTVIKGGDRYTVLTHLPSIDKG